MIYVRVLTDFMLFFFALFLISSTFSIAVSQVTLGISVLFFLIISILKKEFVYFNDLKWFYTIVGLFVGWLILSSLLGVTPLRSLTASKDSWLFLIIPLGIYLTSKFKNRQNLILIFATTIILVSLYGVLQFFTGANWFSHNEAQKAPMYGYRISGFFSFGVTFGNLMSVVGIFLTTYALFGISSFSKNRFRVLLSGGIMAMLMALLTFSRAPILAIVLTTILIFMFLGKKWWKQGVAFTIILLLIISFLPGIKERFINEFDKEYNGTHQAGRVYIWKNSIQLIADNPIIGVGLHNFKESYAALIPSDSKENRKVSSAHNDFIDIAANTGIPGLLFYCILWISVLGYFRKKYHRDSTLSIEQKAILVATFCASICFMIVSMFHGVFVDDEVRQVLMFFWALGFAVTVESRLNQLQTEKNSFNSPKYHKFMGTK